jgi:imidazolonepropionase-like amidohydrolase
LIGRAIPAGNDPLTTIEDSFLAGSDHIKLIQSGLNSLTDFGKQTPPQFDSDTIRRIYAFARARGIGLMVHANGDAPVAAAIAGGCDSIEHGYFMGNDNLRKMADTQITWVPTAMPMKAYADYSPKSSIEYEVARRTLDHQLGQISKARGYGVPVALGTDSGSPGVEHGKSVSEELKLLKAAGYTLEEAVSCATLKGARLLKTDLPGYLAVGTPATFIVVKGAAPNVLEAGGVEMIMVEGRVLRSFLTP